MAVSKTIFNLTEERTSKLAVLIDADNASAKDIENILNELTKYGEATVNSNNKDAVQTKLQSSSNLPLDKIKQIFDNHDTEWVSVASLGSQWKLLQVDFDPRTYGFKKLGDLVKSYPKVFDVEERLTSTSDHKNLYVRLKKTK